LLTQLALSEYLVVTADNLFKAFEAAVYGFDSFLSQLLECRLTLAERLA
jgi:hypothetical protein